MSELVVFCALVIVREYLIGLIDLLESLFGSFVSRMQIRVIFFGKLSVCFFYFIG